MLTFRFQTSCAELLRRTFLIFTLLSSQGAAAGVIEYLVSVSLSLGPQTHSANNVDGVFIEHVVSSPLTTTSVFANQFDETRYGTLLQAAVFFEGSLIADVESTFSRGDSEYPYFIDGGVEPRIFTTSESPAIERYFNGASGVSACRIFSNESCSRSSTFGNFLRWARPLDFDEVVGKGMFELTNTLYYDEARLYFWPRGIRNPERVYKNTEVNSLVSNVQLEGVYRLRYTFDDSSRPVSAPNVAYLLTIGLVFLSQRRTKSSQQIEPK